MHVKVPSFFYRSTTIFPKGMEDYLGSCFGKMPNEITSDDWKLEYVKDKYLPALVKVYGNEKFCETVVGLPEKMLCCSGGPLHFSWPEEKTDQKDATTSKARTVCMIDLTNDSDGEGAKGGKKKTRSRLMGKKYEDDIDRQIAELQRQKAAKKKAEAEAEAGKPVEIKKEPADAPKPAASKKTTTTRTPTDAAKTAAAKWKVTEVPTTPKTPANAGGKTKTKTKSAEKSPDGSSEGKDKKKIKDKMEKRQPKKQPQ